MSDIAGWLKVKTGISNSNLHFYQTKMSARKNYNKATWISLARIKLHQCEWNLVQIIGLNFWNFVSNHISIWLFVYFQTFMQIKTKFFWLQMKKPSEISALLVYSNVIHRNVNIYLWIYDEQKYFLMVFALYFVGSSLILKAKKKNCFYSISRQWNPCCSSNIAI